MKKILLLFLFLPLLTRGQISREDLQYQIRVLGTVPGRYINPYSIKMDRLDPTIINSLTANAVGSTDSAVYATKMYVDPKFNYLNSNASKITSLSSTVTTNTSNISSLSTAATNNANNIVANNNSISSLSSTVGTHTTQINSLSASKVDINNGSSTNQTLTTPNLTSPTITGSISIGTNHTLGNNLINSPTGNDLDFVYPTTGAVRFGANPTMYSDGAGFQGFGGTASSNAGNLYFDYGSTARTIAGRSVVFRNMNISPQFSNVLTLDASNNASFAGNASITGALSTTGGATIGGMLTANGFTSSGGNITVGAGAGSSTINGTTFYPGGKLATSGTSTLSSGTDIFNSFTPTVTQTGTAGYTLFKGNVTETSTGSGAKNLLDLGVGGFSKFMIDKWGNASYGRTIPTNLSTATMYNFFGQAGVLYGTTASNEANFANNMYNSSTGDVYTNTGFATRIQNTTSGDISFQTAPSGTAGSTATLTEAFKISNNLASAFRSTVPSTLNSTNAYLFFGQSGLIDGATNANNIAISNNQYYDGANNKYKATGFASYYNQTSMGDHAWYTAPTGTAGTNATFTEAFRIANNRNITATASMTVANAFTAGNITTTKVITSGSAPTFTAGAGMGTSPTGISVSGNDTAGKITFTTGSSPTSGTIGTLTFTSAYTNAPISIVTGANSAAQVGITLWVVGTETPTGTPIVNTSGNTLAASTTYVMNYQNIGR